MKLEQLTADEIAQIITERVDVTTLIDVCEIEADDVCAYLWHKIEPYVNNGDEFFEEIVEEAYIAQRVDDET